MTEAEKLLMAATAEADDEIFQPLAGYTTVPYSDKNIIYITNKIIGDMSNQIVITGESYSQYIAFERDRYMDGIDLSEKILQIHYERPDGQGDNSPAVNVEVSETKIRYGWVIPGKACVLDGILKVMPFAYGTQDDQTYIQKELYAEIKVNEGLPIDGGIAEPEPEWYTQFLAQMNMYKSDISDMASQVRADKESVEASESNVTEMKQSVENRSTQALNDIATAKTLALQEVNQAGTTQAGIVQTVIGQATAATANANEAAQQIFDQAYILTAQTEFQRSTAVSPTAKGNVLIEQVQGESWQDGTLGVQLFDKNALAARKADTVLEVLETGVRIASEVKTTYREALVEMQLEPNTQYTFFTDLTVNSGKANIGVRISTDDGATYPTSLTHDAGSTTTSKQLSFTFTTDENTYAKFSLYASYETAITCDALFENLMLVKGDTVLPYEDYTGGLPSPNPDYPQEIVSVGDGGELALKAIGKNLLHYEKWVKPEGTYRGTAVYEDNGVTLTATERDAYTSFLSTFPSAAFIHVNEGDIITISWETPAADSAKSGSVFIFPNNVTDGRQKSANNSTAKSLTYTIPAGVTYFSFRFGVTNAGDTIHYQNIQIEKGTERTEWLPYSESTVTIPLSEPLRSVGDVHDEICVQDGVFGVLRRIREVILDGSSDEIWGENNTEPITFWCKPDAGGKPVSPDKQIGLCNRYVYSTASNSSMPDNSFKLAYSAANASVAILIILNSDCTTLNEIKAEMQERPITVLFELETPVFEPFEDQTPFYSLLAQDGVTHISIEGLDDHLNPTAVIRFPRHEDGALATTALAKAMKCGIEAETTQEKIESGYYSLAGGIRIPANADLDDYLEVGNYYVPSNGDAATIANRPEGVNQAFTMKVNIPTGVGAYKSQIIKVLGTGREYYRYYDSYNDTLMPWRQTSNHDDSADDTVTFISGDVAEPTAWESVDLLKTGETHASLFQKISKVFKNVRWLYKMLGTTDISEIGDGTVTGALGSMNDSVYAETFAVQAGNYADKNLSTGAYSVCVTKGTSPEPIIYAVLTVTNESNYRETYLSPLSMSESSISVSIESSGMTRFNVAAGTDTYTFRISKIGK